MGEEARFRMRLVPWRRKRAERAPDPALDRREQKGWQRREVIEEIAAEFTTEELQEFLEADRYPIEADPAFKEELRETLWKLLQSTIRSPSDDS
jgi:hypothetical protein